MERRCCRSLIGSLARVPSPFSRLVATGYYDGPTEGLLECGTCATIYSFKMLDWDHSQDLRVFALSPVSGHTLQEVERGAVAAVTPHWPVWVLAGPATDKIAAVVEQIRSTAAPEEFVVATTNLLGSIEAWRPVGLKGPVDWFRELGLTRE